jgi:hypothetical protein
MVSAALAFAALACSIALPSNDPPTTVIPGDGSGSGTGPSGPGSATLTLVNQSSTDICYVYISPVTDAYWNDSWLDSGETISAGRSRVFDVPPDSYDLRADDCNQIEIDIVWGMAITGGETWAITGTAVDYNGEDDETDSDGVAGGDATLTLTNHSSEPICQVYISPTTDDSWNDDWLGGQTIAPGSSHTFSVTSGRYDLQASDCSGEQLDVVWDTFIRDSQVWWVTDADIDDGSDDGGGMTGGDATLTLTNNSGRTICQVYISPVTDAYWNDNWLGPGETIPTGGSYNFSVVSGDYDLRADDCDNNELDIVWGMTITGSQNWTVP